MSFGLSLYSRCGEYSPTRLSGPDLFLNDDSVLTLYFSVNVALFVLYVSTGVKSS